MRVFAAGASGAVGQGMTRQLIAAGHQVFAITRRQDKVEALHKAGARAVVCDVYDAPRLADAVREAAPDALVHQLTDLPASLDVRKINEVYARNNRVRREGTRNLLAAAAAAGVHTFIVQSMATWYRPEGSAVKKEGDALWTDAPEPIGAAVRTVAEMESAVLGGVKNGIVLRYGAFYGPGTWYTGSGEIARQFRARKLPLIGAGDGITSFIHVDDAASAAVAALDGPPGVYNIADDEPARASEWMAVFAASIGAPSPRRVPAFLARLVLGKALTAWLTTMRGASNERSKRELRWEPHYASWRTGFAETLSAS